eukprot:616280-Pelagomonas_calceolata.AAC.4
MADRMTRDTVRDVARYGNGGIHFHIFAGAGLHKLLRNPVESYSACPSMLILRTAWSPSIPQHFMHALQQPRTSIKQDAGRSFEHTGSLEIRLLILQAHSLSSPPMTSRKPC